MQWRLRLVRCVGGLLLAAPVLAVAADARLLGAHYLGDIPTRVAEQQGMFRRHGLDIEIAYGASGRDNLAALREGRVDFALMAETPLVLNLATTADGPRSSDPVILANLAHSNHLNQVVTLAGNGIDRPSDLRGHRVAMAGRTSSAYLWYLFAAYHGFDSRDVTRIDLQPSRLGDALIEGRADAAVLWEPWTSRLRIRLGERLRVLPGSDLYTAKWLLVTRRAVSDERPALCRAVLAAYRDAIDWIGRHRDLALALFLADAGVGREALADGWDTVLFDLNLDWTLLAGLQQQLDWAVGSGRLPAQSYPDLLSLIDARPLEDLAPELVRIPLDGPGERDAIP